MTIFSRRNFVQVAARHHPPALPSPPAPSARLGTRSQVPRAGRAARRRSVADHRWRRQHRRDGQCRWRAAGGWRHARPVPPRLLKLALQERRREAGAHAVQHALASRPDRLATSASASSGARIIAHENTKLWLGRKIITEWLPEGYGPLPKPALPNKSFYTTDSLDFGGETLAFGHLGQAHTDGDLYVHFTKANVLVAGGVVSSAGWPVLDWQTGGWIGGLVAAYDRLLKVADDTTVVMPANGALIGRKELQTCRDMYFQIFDRTVKQLVKGMGPDEVAGTPISPRNTRHSGATRAPSWSPRSRACGDTTPPMREGESARLPRRALLAERQEQVSGRSPPMMA